MLIDESGFFLNPLVQRTWARIGQTPVLRTFGGHRDKVSVVVALSVAPGGDAPGSTFTPTPNTHLAPQRSSLLCAKCSGTCAAR